MVYMLRLEDTFLQSISLSTMSTILLAFGMYFVTFLGSLTLSKFGYGRLLGFY